MLFGNYFAIALLSSVGMIVKASIKAFCQLGKGRIPERAQGKDVHERAQFRGYSHRNEEEPIVHTIFS